MQLESTLQATQGSHPTNRRILVVDDNESIHSDFRRLLSSSSTTTSADELQELAQLLFEEEDTSSWSSGTPVMEIDCAFQGQEALNLVESAVAAGRPYAAAFVDMRMPPGWDGLTTIRKLWTVDARLETVICTAYSDYDWSDMVAELGDSDQLFILKKPFDSMEVMQLAHALTKRWALKQEADFTRDKLADLVSHHTAEIEKLSTQLLHAERERKHHATIIHNHLTTSASTAGSGPSLMRVLGACAQSSPGAFAGAVSGAFWMQRDLGGGRMLVVSGDFGPGMASAMAAATAKGIVHTLAKSAGPSVKPLDIVSEVCAAGRECSCIAAVVERRENGGSGQAGGRGSVEITAVGRAAGHLLRAGAAHAEIASAGPTVQVQAWPLVPGDSLVLAAQGSGNALSRVKRGLAQLAGQSGEALQRQVNELGVGPGDAGIAVAVCQLVS